jgi:hypothetical protein
MKVEFCISGCLHTFDSDDLKTVKVTMNENECDHNGVVRVTHNGEQRQEFNIDYYDTVSIERQEN